MRIDAHHHLWDLDVRDQPWTRTIPVLRHSFTMDDLRSELHRSAVDATVVVQTLPTPEETPELLALAARDPHIRAVVGWTDLTHPAITDHLSELLAHPGGAALAGIRHGVQDEPDPQWLNRPDARRGLAAVGAAGLAYDLLVRPDQLRAAVRTVREMPDVRFVLDHAGNPEIAPDGLERWTALLAGLGHCDNVAVKLSGLVTRAPAPHAPSLRPYADVLLEQFGPERLMFGSDWPVCLRATDYAGTVAVAESLTGALSTDESAQVYGGTAARWYGTDT
ncbi:amidohydrolase family protein [Streptomyces sp. NPDC057746]|uniref:amidohydrolase family protein n=1 Tax=Streptomyces sp. NPDC057746 TaxID=3346237 RepID=UPI0036AEF6E6